MEFDKISRNINFIREKKNIFPDKGILIETHIIINYYLNLN